MRLHLDLISKVFILATDNIQLLIGFIQGRLQAESLSAEVAALGVASVQLSMQIVRLCLPFAHNLVKVLAPMNEILTLMYFGTP